MTVDFEKSVKLAGRWGLLGLGMFTSASGIACVAQAQLGTTPISSTPYVLAAITGLTFGQTTFWVNVFFHERNGAPARGAPCIENMH